MGTTALRRRRPAFAAGLAALAVALGSTAPPAAAAPPVPDVDLVALGDSYTAGIGAGAYTTDAPCLQTNGGYVDILAKLPITDNVTNAACAGALLDTQSNIAYSIMAQITRLSASGDLSKQTELVTLTAGPNDISFTAPLTTCALYSEEACAQEVKAAQDRFPAMQAELVEALTAIRKAAPRATIAVFGYPLLFDPEHPSILKTRAAAELVNAGTMALNSAIEKATNAPRVKAKTVYIDVTQSFKGHAIASGEPWINFSTDPNFALQNFHPNAAGHEAYADALEGAVNLGSLARRN
jgi:lysophospholipase L1-like esterase